MIKDEKCRNCKYHYIEELSFDYPQSCCSKRNAVIEAWCNCSEFEYSESYINELQQENKQLKEQLSVSQTNEETFRLEMEDITKTLGLDEDTIFDDVKARVRNLKDNWNELREWIVYNKHNENTEQHYLVVDYGTLLGKMQELEQGSDK